MGFCAHARDTHSPAVAPPTHAWGTQSPAAVPHPKAAAAACLHNLGTGSSQHRDGTGRRLGCCAPLPGLPRPPRASPMENYLQAREG